MTELETLAAVLEISALKARYFRTMDSKDWAGLEAVFAPDLEADFRAAAVQWDESQVTYGAAEYIAKLRPILEPITTVHHGHMPEITIETPDSASGIWAMEDMLRWPNGMELHGFGHYHETYRCDDGTWRIAASKLTRLRMDLTPPPED